jgi:hypothetical protein
MSVAATRHTSDWSREAIIEILQERRARPSGCRSALWARLRVSVERHPAMAEQNARTIYEVCSELAGDWWHTRQRGGEPSAVEVVASHVEEDAGCLLEDVRWLVRDLEDAQANRECNESMIRELLEVVVGSMESIGEKVDLAALHTYISPAFAWSDPLYHRQVPDELRQTVRDLLERRVMHELRDMVPSLTTWSAERLAEIIETLLAFREECGGETLRSPRPRELWYHEVYGITPSQLAAHQRAIRLVHGLEPDQLEQITTALDQLIAMNQLEPAAVNYRVGHWTLNPMERLMSGVARERMERALSIGDNDRVACALAGELYGEERRLLYEYH